MFTNSKLAKSIRLAMAFGAASTAMVASNSVLAQEAGAEESVEKIAVTGSRIRKADFVSNAPVATIGQEQFALTATVNTESLLNTLPQVVPGLDRTSNNPGNGTATVDLRGLGTNRTLVLINGTRAVPTTAGGSVDINSIPTALIQDVEVLTGGASAIYGSDAVAGVVNFILKDDFEGVQTSVGYEVTDENDASIWSADLTIGGNFADGKGNVVFNMAYTDRDDLFQGDRDFAQTALFDDGAGGLEPGGSSGVPGGAIFSGSFNAFSPSSGIIFEQDGSARPFVTSGEVNDFYNYAPVNYIQLPQERHQITALGSYEANEHMEFYGRAMFTDSRVPSQLAPTPIFQVSTFSLDNNPFLSAETQELIANTSDNSALVGLAVREDSIFSQTERVDPTDPESPFVCTNCVFDSTGGSLGYNNTTAIIDKDGDGIPDQARALLRRRLQEVGPRRSEDSFNSYQFQAGLRGAIGDSSWSYDVYYQTGKVENTTAQLGNVNRDRFDQALLLASDGGNVIVGADGQPTCADPGANGSTGDCAPMNLFGEGNISQEAADFLKTAVVSNALFDSKTFAATISGDTEDFFELPGGPIGIAVGYEHRDESFEFLPSQDLAAGTIAGFNGAAGLSGGYSVSEQYIEAYLPILSGVELAETLDLELAYRTADYSSIGSVESYKIGGSWAPIEELRFRAGFNTAVRAPNIGELFAPRDENFPSAADPCSADGNVMTEAVRAICLATGVPANVVFSNAIDPPAGQVRTKVGGNPNLTEEKADTLTVGIVVEPMENFTFSLDYFDIEITDAVGAFGGGTNNILAVCYDPTDPRGGVGSAYCNAINRRADGTIDFVEGAAQNVASISLTGYDLIANYSVEVAEGTLSVDYLGTFTEESDFIPGPGEDAIKCAGDFGANCGEPLPEYKHRMTFKYAQDEFTAQLLWRFVGEVNDDDDTTDFTVERIDGFSYFDASATYYINDNYRVTAGIDNLFDKKPPVIGGNDEQANTYPATYDVFGRTYYVNFTASF